MLVIRRRAGEAVLIGEEIEIEILEAGPRVKIGIRAPKSVAILRKEILTVKRQNLVASQSGARGRELERAFARLRTS
jgi:carbon storage regulator